MSLSDLPEIPATAQYAVIFTSLLSSEDPSGYSEMAARMDRLVQRSPGYCGMHTARGEDGLGITVSYWRDDASIRDWRQQAEHVLAQQYGRHRWYRFYQIHVTRVERRHTHY